MNTDQWDWINFLNRAIKGEVMRMSAEKARQLALRWDWCAVGQLCSELPRYPGGMPKDTEIVRLGRDFAKCITEYRWHSALERFWEIKRRTDELTILP